jgi:hypothetical protein
VTFARPEPNAPGALCFGSQAGLVHSAVARVAATQPDVSAHPGFRLVSIVLSIVFSIAIHCSWAGGISLVPAKLYIADRTDFPLQIDCIYFWPVPGAFERAESFGAL